jgi:hypothetical protein
MAHAKHVGQPLECQAHASQAMVNLRRGDLEGTLSQNRPKCTDPHKPGGYGTRVFLLSITAPTKRTRLRRMQKGGCVGNGEVAWSNLLPRLQCIVKTFGQARFHLSIPRDSVSRTRALLHPLQSRVLVPDLASWFRSKLVL